MSIPRFNAQIQAIQVPSMKNYQEEENASIAKSLADFGGKIIGISAKIGFEKKEEKPNVYYERLKQMQKETSMDTTITRV